MQRKITRHDHLGFGKHAKLRGHAVTYKDPRFILGVHEQPGITIVKATEDKRELLVERVGTDGIDTLMKLSE